MNRSPLFLSICLAGLNLASADRAAAVILLSEDFSGGNGGFSESHTGVPTPGNEWTYNAGAGTWSTIGDDNLGTPTNSMLTSPSFVVPNGDPIQISFDHRYSFEDEWDGGAVLFAVNAGAFQRIDISAFSQEGYRAFALLGNHDLTGLDGFNQDSAGFVTGAMVTSIAQIPGVAPGDSLQIQFLGAFDEFAGGANSPPTWEIDSVTVSTIPEPSSALLIVFGIAGISMRRRRSK